MLDVTGVVLAAAEGVDEDLGQALEGLTAGDWITAATVLVLAVGLSGLLQRLTAGLLTRGDGEAGASQFVGRVVASLVVTAGFVYALQILGVGLTPLLGALGIGGLALAFAAQSILENVFASVVLQARRSFRRGDQIETNDIEGTVEDVNFRTLVLRTYDGERVLVPCSLVLNNPITNFTARGTRRTTLAVGVAFDTDLRRAQDVLLAAVASVEGVSAQPQPQAWVEQFGESSIDFALLWWHAPDNATLWRVRSDVAMAVKVALDGASIEIPFPHRLVGFLPGVELDVRTAGGGGDEGERGDDAEVGDAEGPT